MISGKTVVPDPDDPYVRSVSRELAHDLPGFFGSVTAIVWRELVNLPAGMSPDDVGDVIAEHLTRMVAVGVVLERNDREKRRAITGGVL
jgi:hypothetical protein